MTDLYYVPFDEFNRMRGLPISATSRAALFATLCRINTLYMITRAGSGHIGTSFSCIDIVSWLFLNEIRRLEGDRGPRDIYFSSKGHDAPALYSVLIGLGLLDFDLLHKLRRLGGLPGHPDVSIPFIETNTGSLGMGVSKAKGMALANRLLGQEGAIYVLTGDGELQEGQFWESLPSATNLRLGEITVIVDHNKIQSDTWVCEVSDLGDLEAKLQVFGWHVVRCDGHDLRALAETFRSLKALTDRPKIVVADTLKGKGVSFMQPDAMDPLERLYRFHSGAPNDDVYARAASELIATANTMLTDLGFLELKLEVVKRPVVSATETVQRLVAAYSKELVRQGERKPNLVALDADLVLDCGLIPFRQRFPDRFFECGIAEQDMVSQAGGMALKGLLPVVHSFACFLSTRANEQIYNNATERTKIIYVGSLAGLLPGGPGHSHQSVRDISCLCAIPGLILLEPCNETEVEMAVDFCINGTAESCYVRLTSIPCVVQYKLPVGYRLQPGRGVPLTRPGEAIIFGYGPVLLSQAYEASRVLSNRGIRLCVVNMPWLNRVDAEWLRDLVAGYQWVFTLDNHYLSGGLGDLILSQLALLGLEHPPLAKKLGVSTIPACGLNDEVLKAHRLDADSLCEDIQHAVESQRM
jgi:transketolase